MLAARLQQLGSLQIHYIGGVIVEGCVGMITVWGAVNALQLASARGGRQLTHQVALGH
jgi:hypothetical protein